MPKFQKGSQEAKDYMKSIREKRTTTSNIDYETFKGKKSKKNITLNLEKEIDTLPSGEKVVKSTTRRKMNGNPIEQNINQIIVPAKKGGRPKKYATIEEAKQAKKEKTLASNKKKYAEKKALKAQAVEGEGVFGNIKDSFNKIGRDIKRGFNKDIVKPIDKIAHKAQEYGKAVLYGRNDYPPKVRDILKNVGHQTIKSITIKRTPVSGLLTGALSVFSLGKFGKRMERSFDELFHLFIELTLDNDRKVILEKNEVINMESTSKPRPDTESKLVNSTISPLPLDELLNNTEEYMGKRNFFGYSAKDNNCQDFIVSFFKANKMGDESDIQFIKQDTKSLFRDLPKLRKLSNTLTDLGAKVNVITTGKGVKDIKNYSKILKHLSSHITDPKEPIDRRDFNQAKDMINAIMEQKNNIKGNEKNKISNNNIEMSGGKMEVHHYHHMIHYPKGKGVSGRYSDSDSECSSDSDMEGGKINIGKAFKKLGSDIKKGFNKDIAKPTEKIANKTGKYITSKKGGLATDLITYGIPATSAAILGALGSATGNPALGVAGSALGSKLGNEYIAPAVHKASGAGVRTGRFVKGSKEAKEHMARIRNMKKN